MMFKHGTEHMLVCVSTRCRCEQRAGGGTDHSVLRVGLLVRHVHELFGGTHMHLTEHVEPPTGRGGRKRDGHRDRETKREGEIEGERNRGRE